MKPVGTNPRRAQRVRERTRASSIEKPRLAEPQGELLPPGERAAQERVLRVGVVQAGRVIEERIFRERRAISIGASPSCDITVPAAGLPRRLKLFEVEDEQYRLVCPEGVDGRIAFGERAGEVLTLEQARAAKPSDDAKRNRSSLPVDDGARGKLTLGELTLLFQFVLAPAQRPLPQLPPSVRGGVFGQLDWLFAGSWAVAACATFAFVVVLHGLDFPRDTAPDKVPDRFAQLVPLVDRPALKLDLKRLKQVGEGKLSKVPMPRADSPGKRKQPHKARKQSRRRVAKTPSAPPCDAACQAQRAAQRRARLVKAVSRMGVMQVLGVKSKEGGAVRNLLRSGNPGSKADKAFKGVDGVRTSQRGPGLVSKPGSTRGPRGPVTIDDLDRRIDGPKKVETKITIVERVPKVRVKRKKTKIDPTLTMNGVASILRRGVRLVKSCYQRAIKRGVAQGKINVVLTVNGLGRVTDVELTSNTLNLPHVNACVKSLARRLKFPPPSDGQEAEISFSLVFRSKK